MSSKKLINTPETCIEDAVQGMLLLYPHLKRMGNFNVLVREDIEEYKQSHVTLISGGGSGHEPAHAGYIGNGMLSGAVLGNVFASPSVTSILNTIRLCAGPQGVLVVVKNYTGDRLNFGMAIETAKAEGILARMIIVDDDCALPIGKGITGGRGVAGTCFVHKLAGAFAHEQSAEVTLDDVYNLASRVVGSIGSLGVALSVCTVPGGHPSSRLDDIDLVELGMGIHGEPGREQLRLSGLSSSRTPDSEPVLSRPASSLMVALLAGIVGKQSFTQSVDPEARLPLEWENISDHSNEEKLSTSVALMLNNLGGLSQLEMLICAKEVLQSCGERGIVVSHIAVGSFMTALNMHGVSLSVLRLDGRDSDGLFYRLLTSPTTAPGWLAGSCSVPRSGSLLTQLNSVVEAPKASTTNTKEMQEIGAAEEIQPNRATFTAADIETLLGCIRIVCQRIIQIESHLTHCDSICGDGDCGIVLASGARALLTHADSTSAAVQWTSPASVCISVAESISMSMGGTLGAVLEILFRAMAAIFRKGGSLVEALRAAVEAIGIYGGASVGMRTMLDAFVPAVQALEEEPFSIDSLRRAAGAAERGAEATQTLAALAGRANYIHAEMMNGVPDPGAIAVATALRAIADYYDKIPLN